MFTKIILKSPRQIHFTKNPILHDTKTSYSFNSFIACYWTNCIYYQLKYAIQLAILNYLHLNCFCPFTYYMLIKDFTSLC